jgi:hypothetical protein
MLEKKEKETREITPRRPELSRMENPMATSISKSQGKASEKVSRAPTVSAEERYNMIAEAAYYRAEQRGFQDGDTVADWLAAETEIDGKLAKSG